MKKVLALFVAVSVFTSTFASGSASLLPTSKPAPLNAAELFIPIGKEGKKISLLELSQIRMKDFEKLSGHKLNFTEKIKFRIVQNQLAKNINSDNTINAKKFLSKPAKKATEKSKKYMRTWLILLIVALVCALLALVLPFFGILSLIFGLGFLIFFILWLVE